MVGWSQVYNSARLTYLLGTMGSVRSNVKVTSGCWFYEVVIGTENLYQIGWSSKDTKFTRSEGVQTHSCTNVTTNDTHAHTTTTTTNDTF